MSENESNTPETGKTPSLDEQLPVAKPEIKPDPSELGSYIEAGYDLIPLHAWNAITERGGKKQKRGKSPLHRNWPKRPYDAFDAVAHMRSGKNVGVRLRAVDLVIDVDPRNDDGRWNVPDFDEFCLRFSLDLTTWECVETGGGGRHYYLRKPENAPVANRLPDFPGVEFKTIGSQVVAAGSVHPDTRRIYRWDAVNNDLRQPPTCPEALLDALRLDRREATVTQPGVYAPDELEAMLERLDPEDFREQDDWLRLMLACHHATSGAGREQFVAWSTSDPAYSDHGEVIKRRWDSLDTSRTNAVTSRTLHKLLLEAGAQDAIPRSSAEDDFEPVTSEDLPSENGPNMLAVSQGALSISKNSKASDDIANALRTVNKSGLCPCFDELKQQVVFRAENLPWGEEFGRTLDDHTLRLVRGFLMEAHQGVDYQPAKENVFEAVCTLAYQNKFNPVLSYLDSLQWDGVPRLERLFPRYFGTEESEFAAAVSRCFMVAAVRRQRAPGCKFDTMPVLRGKQGGGKSTGVKVLFGNDWFSDADMGDLRGKDAALALQGIWVQEFPELDGMRRADVDTLKAFCSRAVDRVRPPYGRTVQELPRRCVFVGTVNEGGYLKDGTGNRRFWPLEVKGTVDIKALAADRDQLWAEADHLERTGSSVVLDEALWSHAAERQAEETSEDPWIDLIRSFLEDRRNAAHDWALGEGEYGDTSEERKPRPADKVHTRELLSFALDIGADRQSRGHAQRLRTVMESGLGWTYKRSIRIGQEVMAGYEKPHT